MKTLLKGNRTRISDFIKVVIVSIIAVLFCRSNLMGVSDATEILLNAINDEKFVSMAAEKDLHLVVGEKLVLHELSQSNVSGVVEKRVCKKVQWRPNICDDICKLNILRWRSLIWCWCSGGKLFA